MKDLHPPPDAVADADFSPALHHYAAQEIAIEMLEAERRRIAHLLDEQIINPLNLVLAQAHIYDQTLPDPQVRMVVSVLATLVRQAVQQTRDLEAQLSLSALESLGLESALEMFASQQSRTSGLRITLALPALRERLPGSIELALLRATQDVTDYLMRAANASTLIISLAVQAGQLRYVLSANGLLPDGPVLATTQQRIRALGGQWHSSAGRYGGLEITILLTLAPAVGLTEREQQVLGCLTEGLSNKAIAARLHLSPRTVKFHLDNIFSKLHVSTRTEAAIYALRHQLIAPP